MFSRETSLKVYLFVIILAVFASTAQAKSVYVISNTNTAQLQAYRIEDANLVHHADYVCKTGGAVGLAIDESEYGDFLFVTFENSTPTSARIEIVDANTMQYVDIVTTAGMDYSKILSNRVKAVLGFTPQAFDQPINSIISTRLLAVSQL